MKAFFFTFSLLCCAFFSLAQDENKTESLLKVLSVTKNDTARVWAIHDVAFNYLYSNTDSSAFYAQQALSLSKKINYDRGIIRSMNDIGNTLNVTGSNSSALQIYLDVLVRSEKIKDGKLKGISLSNIGEIYKNLGDYMQAIHYALQSLAISLANHDTIHLLYNYINLGEYYQKANLIDSSIMYTNLAYQLAIKTNDTENIGDIQFLLGNTHSAIKNDDTALPYYYKAAVAHQLVGNDITLGKIYYSIAKLFTHNERNDSAFVYSRKSFETSEKVSDKSGMLDAASLLASLFEIVNNDSAIKYLKITIALKDSLFNQEKSKQVQSLTINEQLRQSKLREEKELAAEERRKNLQMIGIGAFIPLFFGVVLLFNKRKAKPKVIEFTGLLGLLLLFEFIALFIHPQIEEWTHHTPVLMLLILVVFAAILVPLHHKLEKKIKEKFVHKPTTFITGFED